MHQDKLSLNAPVDEVTMRQDRRVTKNTYICLGTNEPRYIWLLSRQKGREEQTVPDIRTTEPRLNIICKRGRSRHYVKKNYGGQLARQRDKASLNARQDEKSERSQRTKQTNVRVDIVIGIINTWLQSDNRNGIHVLLLVYYTSIGRCRCGT